MVTTCREVKICIGTDSNKAKMFSSIKLQKKKKHSKHKKNMMQHWPINTFYCFQWLRIPRKR